jgi:hypothetical protein
VLPSLALRVHCKTAIRRAGVTRVMFKHYFRQLRPLQAHLFCWNWLQVTLSVRTGCLLLVLVARPVAAGLRNRQVANWPSGSTGTVIPALCPAAAGS